MKKALLWFLAGTIALFLYALWSFSSFLFLVPHVFSFTNTENSYLITLHNEGELRPNLGFLTGFILVSHNGENWNMEFHDSYDITAPSQKILAPEIIEDRFSSDVRYQGWVFRDSNFSLSYEKNAETMLQFMKYDNRYSSKKIHTVLSLDLYTIGKIIDAVGGVEFEGKKVSSQNIFEILENNAKNFNPETTQDWLQRKGSIKPLANEIIKEIIFSPFRWNEINNAIQQMFHQNHVLMYSLHPPIQEKLEKRNWSGVNTIERNTLPYGINFANIGGKKGDRYTNRNVSSVFMINEEGNIQERLIIDIFHNGTRNLHSDRYFGYTQIVRPKGSSIIKSDGEYLGSFTPQKKEEEYDNTSQFDFFFQVDEGNTTRFEITFEYPKELFLVEKNSQPLFFIPQPGQLNTVYNITLQGVSDTRPQILGCKNTQHKENIALCSFENIPEESISFSLSPDTTPPIFEDIIYSDGGRKVRIQFSERLNTLQRKDITFKNNTTGESIPIVSIFEDERAVEFELETVLSKSQRQFYTVQIKNVSDIFGNTIEIFDRTVAYPKYKPNL